MNSSASFVPTCTAMVCYFRSWIGLGPIYKQLGPWFHNRAAGGIPTHIGSRPWRLTTFAWRRNLHDAWAKFWRQLTGGPTMEYWNASIHPSIHTYIIHTNIHINTSTTISRWLNYRDSRMTLKIFYDVPALTRDGQPIWIHPSVARYTPVPGSAAECSYDSLHTIKSSVKKWGRQWSRWCFSSLCRSPKHLQASICTAKRMAPRWNTLNRLCPIAL